MNVISREIKIRAISALCEGMSIRATERLTGAHRDTIMRLGAKIGAGCAAVHNAMMRDLNVAHVQLDEAWSYVGKKQRNLRNDDSADLGDQYVFIAMDTSHKAILSYLTGKRTSENAISFTSDLRERIVNEPEISSDDWTAYPLAIDIAFTRSVSYGQVVKHYAAEGTVEASRRYSAADVVKVEKAVISGTPKRIVTSHVERQNLTLPMTSKRLARLSNGFSKKLENHRPQSAFTSPITISAASTRPSA